MHVCNGGHGCAAEDCTCGCHAVVPMSSLQFAAVVELQAAGWRYQPGFGPTPDDDRMVYLEAGPEDENAVQGAVDHHGMVVGLGGMKDDVTPTTAIAQVIRWLREEV